MLLIITDSIGADYNGNPIDDSTPFSSFYDTSIATIPISIDDTKSLNIAVNIYPNPTSSNAFINITGNDITDYNATLALFDLSGKQLGKSQKIMAWPYKISTEKLTDGMYIYQISLTSDRSNILNRIHRGKLILAKEKE